MTPIPNPRVVLAKLPIGYPIPGEHLVYDDSPSIDLDSVPLKGGYLTKTLVLSPEPYMRERMRDRSIDSYSTTLTVGKPVVGTAVVVVLRSEDENVKVGDHMVGFSPWEAYTVQPYERPQFKPEAWGPYTFDMDSLALRTVSNPGNAIRWASFCSALGTPGLTGWTGFEAYAEAKEGETIFISSGASGVGQMVIQIAKLRGLKVIASAGSSEKVQLMKELGADVAFNYKESKTADVLKEYGPLDIYWDNVGGETLETAIANSAHRGRLVICGSISEYNIPFHERHGIKNVSEIWKRRLTMRGVLVPDLVPTFGERFFTEVPPLIAQGKIKTKEHITRGLENAPQAFLNMLKEGGTLGKPVVVVADE